MDRPLRLLELNPITVDLFNSEPAKAALEREVVRSIAGLETGLYELFWRDTRIKYSRCVVGNTTKSDDFAESPGTAALEVLMAVTAIVVAQCQLNDTVPAYQCEQRGWHVLAEIGDDA